MPEEQVKFYHDGIKHFLRDVSNEALQEIYYSVRGIWLHDKEKRTKEGEMKK